MAPQSYKQHYINIKGVKGPSNQNRAFRKGDVVFAEHVSFDGEAGSKGRPIVYLGHEGTMVSYAKCTTVKSLKKLQLPIVDLTSAGLNKETFIEPEIKNISASKLKYRMGHLCDEDLDYLRSNIRY